MEHVILVNEYDIETGIMEKMKAHEDALLHRAISIFIFNQKGEMLLQQRAEKKYHSGSLWTNACCSHPKPGEQTEAAARRRLKEELGFETPLREIFNFTYKALLEKNLTEYEYDHVFTGSYDGEVYPDANEVKDYCYKTMDEIHNSLRDQAHKYTAWFKIAFPTILTWWKSQS